MLFTPPPGYSPQVVNRQTIGQRGAAGTQSVMQSPPPAFPGAIAGTGSVGGVTPAMGSSSYSLPSSFPMQNPQAFSTKPRSPLATPAPNPGLAGTLSSLKGPR